LIVLEARSSIEAISFAATVCFGACQSVRHSAELLLLITAIVRRFPRRAADSIDLIRALCVISVTDFLGAASKVAQRDGRLVEMYLFAACVYFIISLTASRVVQQLQHRVAIIR
jgi:glutamate/aspartate transport system permease protein